MDRAGSSEMLVEVYLDGVGRIFSEKAGNHLQEYTVSQTRRLQ